MYDQTTANADRSNGGASSAARPSQALIRKAATASAVGTAIEWYDYSLYGAASGLVINKLFFPDMSPLSATLATFATFAVGFFARPLGGVIIGHIGDRYGRKPALLLTIALMGFATVAMGLLPTYSQIGALAIFLLVLLRVVQGFGAGAELAGAFTLVAEYAPANRRVFYTAIPNVSTVIGVLLGTAAFLSLSNLPEAVLLGWAWRLPFLVSVLLIAVAFYIRKHLDETPEYVSAVQEVAERRKEKKIPLGELLRNSPKEVICGFLSCTGQNAYTYVLNTFSISYMVNTLEMSKNTALLAVTIASACSIVSGLLFARLADRIGSDRVYISGCIFLILFAYPLFWMLNTKDVALAAIAITIAYTIGWGSMGGAQGGMLSNMFPTKYRFSGIAVAREFNGALIGGPTPFIAAALVAYASGSASLLSLYLIVCCLVSAIAVFAVRGRLVHH